MSNVVVVGELETSAYGKQRSKLDGKIKKPRFNSWPLFIPKDFIHRDIGLTQ